MTWLPGETIVRREVWRGYPRAAFNVVVVADDPDLLVTYLPEGAEFVFTDDHPLGPHPWAGRTAWEGHGALMLQQPGESYAVWHFWEGPDRNFAGWYFNIQEPFRRTTLGYDTQDLELDVWAPVAGGWVLKDDDLLDVRVSQGRFTPVEAEEIRAVGTAIGAALDADDSWWGDWSAWKPDPVWLPGAPPRTGSRRNPQDADGPSRRARAGRATAAAVSAPTSSTRRAAPSGSERGERGRSSRRARLRLPCRPRAPG